MYRAGFARARPKLQVFLVVASVLILSTSVILGQIRGTLSNFDARNDTNRVMTNLELDMRLIQPTDVLNYYQGPNSWGVPPIVRDVGGMEVTWADFRNPLLPGMMRHFGLALTPDAPPPCGVTAHWTQHLKVVEIPVPWQTWRSGPLNQVIDVIRNNPQFDEPVTIRRQFLTLETPVPLDQLNWDLPTPLPWQAVPGDPVVVMPGAVVELPIPVLPSTAAVLVRYEVARASNPENVITRFVNEAELATFVFPPVIVGSLSNFDVVNDTGKPVHDLELDIRNITPNDIQGWYTGSNAWGVPPVIRQLDALPTTEVTWVDEWNPLAYGQMRHFGLRLNPNTPEPLVRAFWTRVVKTHQIPVPWQWWETQPNVVRDVIQLSDMFPTPVVIERQWAILPTPVPLANLVWDNPSIPWQPDPAGPIEIQPGVQSFFDIWLDVSVAQAVAMRYTVTPQGGSNTPVTRFVNEAVLGPHTGFQPQILGSLSNFDAINLTGVPVTNLELDLRGIQPHHIMGWYQGPMAWGLNPITQAPIFSPLPQTEVTWADFRNPLLPGQTRHFGIELNPGAPITCGVQAYWTRHEKIADIPVPWQTWEPRPGQIVDVIRLPADFPQPVLIQRQFALSMTRLPLNELNWRDPDPFLSWQPYDPSPIPLSPGGTALLPIPFMIEARAAYVRYTVALSSSPGQVVTRFVNEAQIETLGPVPTIVGSLSNFDATNLTGKPVHDLELDIQHIAPAQILGWYTGARAWGIPPVIASLGVGGTEVTWVDDRLPMQPGETRHFGISLAPNAPEPLVRASWTREVKVSQIPVPWQFWLVPPGNFIRDVVQLSDTFDRAVTIRRDFALTVDPVPLDLLNWDLPAPWQPGDPSPITLSPGFQADLDIPVDWRRWGGVLVRYEVTLPDGMTPVRFVNEAILGPGIVSGLHFDTNKVDILWNAAPLQSALYDIVSGKISAMRLNGGVQDGTCMPLGNNLTVPRYTDLALPPRGDGFYYLVRSVLPVEVHGTYDSVTDPLQRENRDLEIGPGDCP